MLCLMLDVCFKEIKTQEGPRWMLDHVRLCLKVCSPSQVKLVFSHKMREKVVILNFGKKSLSCDSDFPALGLVVFSSLPMNQNPVCSWGSHS